MIWLGVNIVKMDFLSHMDAIVLTVGLIVIEHIISALIAAKGEMSNGA